MTVTAQRKSSTAGSIALLLKTVFVAALLVHPLPADAQGHPKMKGYLLSVERLYSALEYEKALEQISRAKRLSRTEEDDVLLSLYEGIVLADMNRWDEATAAFQAALFMNPDAKLPLAVSPKVESRFEAVRVQVRQELANAKPSAGEAASARAPKQDDSARTPLPSEALPVASSPTSGGRSLMRPQVLIPAIGGAVLMVAGGTSWMLSRHELSRLRNNDATLTTREAVHLRASRGTTYQAVGIGLVGAGVVSVGVAMGLFLAIPTNEVALGMATDGSSAFVVGRWP